MTTLIAVGCSFIFFLLGGLIGWLARGNSWATRRDLAQQAELSRALVEHQADTVSDTMMPVIGPLQDSLQGLSHHIEVLEKQRIHEFSRLSESVMAMQRSSQSLASETTRLSSALRSPNIRGRWGEVQLERVAELSGMAAHCDFETQHYVRTDSQNIRPDMVITLTHNRTIVVDAKVPFDAYLTAINAANQESAEEARQHCVKAVRHHIAHLSKKAYWSAFTSCPEFVVLFVPSDSFLDTVLQADPTLLETAFSENVVLATPTTLIALLRTVALTWQHESLAHDAQEIQKLGKELYERAAVVNQHLTQVGHHLGKAVDSYNSTLGSLESRFFVSARKLQELGVTSAQSCEPVPEIDHYPRAGSSFSSGSR